MCSPWVSVLESSSILISILCVCTIFAYECIMYYCLIIVFSFAFEESLLAYFTIILTLMKLSPRLTWMFVKKYFHWWPVLRIFANQAIYCVSSQYRCQNWTILVFYDREQVQLSSSYSMFSQFVGPASVIFVCCNVSVCAGILFTIFISPSPRHGDKELHYSVQFDISEMMENIKQQYLLL